MNKIIFDTFLREKEEEMDNKDMFPVKLILPPEEEKEVPYYGMV